MITDPFAKIRPEIREVLTELVPPEDDYHYKHLRRFARTLQVLLDQKPTGTLLELGTSGVLPLALSELAPDLDVEVTNFDETEDVTHVYRVSIGTYSGKFPAYQIDLEYSPIPADDETYDWVVCCEVLEHMEIDPMYMLSEVNRVTKENGGLLLTTPNVVSSRGLTKMVTGIEPYFYMQYRKDRSYHRHNYEYSIHTVAKVLKSAGFDGSIWTEDNFEDSMPTVADRLRKAGFNINHIGDNIMTVAHKKGPVADRYPDAIYAD